MKFQVGLAHDLSSSDPWFHDERDAIEAANRLHEHALPFGKETVAVWDERHEYVYLFFDGEMFKKV